MHDYIQKQRPNFRLNFFVDEVGQYIADNVKLMTNLQTIAESLATKCKGQAWVMVTAQADMDLVLGDMGKQMFAEYAPEHAWLLAYLPATRPPAARAAAASPALQLEPLAANLDFVRRSVEQLPSDGVSGLFELSTSFHQFF